MGQDSYTLERGSWKECTLSHHAGDHECQEVWGDVIAVVLSLCQSQHVSEIYAS